MKRNELRNIRAQRDHRFNRAWWAFFLIGCLAAFVSVSSADSFSTTPWLILGGLVGMIVGRRQHARRVAEADAVEDLQAARAEAAEDAMAREATRATELQAKRDQDDQQGPPSGEAH